MQVSSFWIGTDAKTTEPCLELDMFSIIHNLCQQNKKGVKVNSEHPNRCRKSKSLSRGCAPTGAPVPVLWTLRGHSASVQLNHPGKAAPFGKVNLGVHFWQKGCLGRGEEQTRRTDSLSTRILFPTCLIRLRALACTNTWALNCSNYTVLCCSFTTAQPVTKKRT